MTKVLLAFILFLAATLSACSLSNPFSSENVVDKSSDNANDKKDNESSDKQEAKDDDDDDDEGLGSDYNELELFFEGIRSYDGERYNIAKTMFKKLVDKYPGSPLTLVAELKIADSLFFGGHYAEAIGAYREFINLHSTHEAKPYAMYQIARSFQLDYQGSKQDETPLKEAVKAYIELVGQYPNSYYSQIAKGQILECDRLLLSSEKDVIAFYLKQGEKEAAYARLISAKKAYSHVPEVNQMLDFSLDELKPNKAKASNENKNKSEIQTSTTELNLRTHENKSESSLPANETLTNETVKEEDTEKLTATPPSKNLGKTEDSAIGLANQNKDGSLNQPDVNKENKKEDLPRTLSNITAEPIKPASERPEEVTANSRTLASLDPMAATKAEPKENDALTPALGKLQKEVIPDSAKGNNTNSFLLSAICSSDKKETTLELSFKKGAIINSSNADISPGAFGPSTFKNKIVFQDKFSLVPFTATDLEVRINEHKLQERPKSSCDSTSEMLKIIEKVLAKTKVADSEASSVVELLIESSEEKNIKISLNSERNKVKILIK